MSPPIRSSSNNNSIPNKPHHHHRPALLPDLFLTALSLLFIFSSTSPKLHHLILKIPPFSLPPVPRRLFLKSPITIMSQTKPKDPNLNHFSTPQSLSDWLKPRLPSDSFSSWGVKPGTKNVHNLWLELSQGETSLLDSTPPLRTVHVATVRILDSHGRVLLESHQELSDGTVRERCRPLSEKMKPGESIEDAVARAVSEELGSIIRASYGNVDVSGLVRIVPGSYQTKVEERVSASYPGLPARYVLHSVDAWVEGLPKGDFCTEEEEEYGDSCDTKIAEKAVFVKRHFWKWIGPDSSVC
ncbi:PREDICTED: uncharacterized protein LOC104593342 [Nelumbo nucifera]|uniref:Uncharacterized protein LOC104593342 n=1 Tax=Nelumbo nucifera TaxID=4432 RepID=A0A1U7ZSZ5_NELNU|nr:PREDICTED: uncharacterized protein LOC104593342 [Nelumbo nucifera]